MHLHFFSMEFIARDWRTSSLNSASAFIFLLVFRFLLPQLVSKLAYIKNYLRSKMNQYRTKNLILLSIEYSLARNFDAVIYEFEFANSKAWKKCEGSICVIDFMCALVYNSFKIVVSKLIDWFEGKTDCIV